MTRRTKLLGLLAGLILVVIAGAVAAPAQMARAMVEKPDYDVLKKGKGYEIRRYPEMLAAQVRLDQDAGEAMNQGFRPLADYIFGDNVDESKIAMTAPVTQEADTSSKIAMTTPVTQASADGEQLVRFIMPSEYTQDTLPRPTNPDVEIVTIPEQTVAVIRFSLRGKHEQMLKKEAKLHEALARDAIAVVGEATYARYDPPWTLPIFRRNEVMLPVAWTPVPE